MIFKLADGQPDVGSTTEGTTTQGSKNGVAWVLRFGGLMALVCGHPAMISPAPLTVSDWGPDFAESAANKDRKGRIEPHVLTFGADEAGDASSSGRDAGRE